MKRCALLLVILAAAVCVYGQQGQVRNDSLLLAYYQNQHFEQALELLKAVHPEPVQDTKFLSALAYTAQMAGNLPQAEAYYERLYALDTTNTASLYNLGSIQSRRGNFAGAFTNYKKIAIKDTTNFKLYQQMGLALQSSGNVTEAMSYLFKANKLNPTEAGVAYDLTSYYLLQHRYLTADSIVTLALAADTANMMLRMGKAQTCYQLQKYEQTIILCRALIRDGQQTNLVVSMLGISYFNTKQYANCIEALEILEKSTTANESSYYYTAMSYKALHRQKIAISYFEKAAKEGTSGNLDTYYSEMGESFEQLHELLMAKKHLKKVYCLK